MRKRVINTANNNKLSILFISSDRYPPFRVDSTILIAKEMTSRGHNIDWVLQSEDSCDTSYETTWSGCHAWVGKTDNGISIINRLRKHYYSITHQMKLFGLVRKNKYSFIQVKNKFVVALAAIIASKLYKTKFIYWLSFPFPEASLYRAKEGTARYPFLYIIRGYVFKFLLYKIIMPAAYHVFVQSEQMKKDVMKMGISSEKLTPVPMGVSLSEFDSTNEKENQDAEIKNNENLKSVVYLGTLEQSRGIDFLVRVLDIVLKKQPDTILYLVGGDREEDMAVLKQEASRLGIADSLIITGFLPREEAMKYVNDADVCVSPFRPSKILNSASPTKLVEYMAMGKAVVANDHPEQKYVIEQSKAGICVPYKEDAFASAILALLDNVPESQAMGKRGRKYVEEHRDYKIIADKLENKYFEISANDN